MRSRARARAARAPSASRFRAHALVRRGRGRRAVRAPRVDEAVLSPSTTKLARPPRAASSGRLRRTRQNQRPMKPCSAPWCAAAAARAAAAPSPAPPAAAKSASPPRRRRPPRRGRGRARPAAHRPRDDAERAPGEVDLAAPPQLRVARRLEAHRDRRHAEAHADLQRVPGGLADDRARRAVPAAPEPCGALRSTKSSRRAPRSHGDADARTGTPGSGSASAPRRARGRARTPRSAAAAARRARGGRALERRRPRARAAGAAARSPRRCCSASPAARARPPAARAPAGAPRRASVSTKSSSAANTSSSSSSRGGALEVSNGGKYIPPRSTSARLPLLPLPHVVARAR